MLFRAVHCCCAHARPPLPGCKVTPPPAFSAGIGANPTDRQILGDASEDEESPLVRGARPGPTSSCGPRSCSLEGGWERVGRWVPSSEVVSLSACTPCRAAAAGSGIWAGDGGRRGAGGRASAESPCEGSGAAGLLLLGSTTTPFSGCAWPAGLLKPRAADRKAVALVAAAAAVLVARLAAWVGGEVHGASAAAVTSLSAAWVELSNGTDSMSAACCCCCCCCRCCRRLAWGASGEALPAMCIKAGAQHSAWCRARGQRSGRLPAACEKTKQRVNR